MRTRPVRWIVAALFMPALAMAAAQGGTAALRIAHMSPDAPLIDALIGRVVHLRDMAFSEVSGYVALPAGDYEIRIFPHRPPLPAPGEAPADGDEQDQEPTINSLALEPITLNATLQEGTYYTAVLTGFFEPPTDEQQLGALSIDPTPEQARFTVSGPRGFQVSMSGEQLLTNLEPGAYTVMAGLEGYQPASYDVQLEPGTTTVLTITLQRAEGEAQVPDIRQSTQASQWQRVELHLYQDELPSFPDAGRTQVRLIHASPVTPSLNVGATARIPGDDNDTNEPAPEFLAENLAFPNNSDYTALRAGSYTLQLESYGGGQPLAAVPLGLESGAIYTLFLVGTPADGYLEVIPNIDGVTSP